MNRFFTGLPRAGKTKAAVAVAFDAILGGRKVAALLAFKVNEWTDGADAVHRGLLRRLQMRGYRGELSEDLRLLTDDEAREFWRYRWDRRERAWGVMPCGDEHFEFDAANYAGCLYILDEVHRLFPSQSSSGLLREYLSQSGRCGDDVIAISQVPVMAHKSLRDLAHEEVFAVNHALRRAWFFREPDIIVCHVYSRCPHLDTDQRQYAFTLRGRREELEDCYDTSGGGAMLGQTAADIGARAGGLHLGWLAAVSPGSYGNGAVVHVSWDGSSAYFGQEGTTSLGYSYGHIIWTNNTAFVCSPALITMITNSLGSWVQTEYALISPQTAGKVVDMWVTNYSASQPGAWLMLDPRGGGSTPVDAPGTLVVTRTQTTYDSAPVVAPGVVSQPGVPAGSGQTYGLLGLGLGGGSGSGGSGGGGGLDPASSNALQVLQNAALSNHLFAAVNATNFSFLASTQLDFDALSNNLFTVPKALFSGLDSNSVNGALASPFLEAAFTDYQRNIWDVGANLRGDPPDPNVTRFIAWFRGIMLIAVWLATVWALQAEIYEAVNDVLLTPPRKGVSRLTGAFGWIPLVNSGLQVLIGVS